MRGGIARKADVGGAVDRSFRPVMCNQGKCAVHLHVHFIARMGMFAHIVVWRQTEQQLAFTRYKIACEYRYHGARRESFHRQRLPRDLADINNRLVVTEGQRFFCSIQARVQKASSCSRSLTGH
jgi:diadenosine tetraphosphate (Ap4A) HIT family hydrolase